MVLLRSRVPEGAGLGRERWWLRLSYKKARGEAAPAAVAANQAVAIDFVAAPLDQVARLENERGNGRADTRHRGRGLAQRQPAGYERRREGGAAQPVPASRAGCREHIISPNGRTSCREGVCLYV